MPVCARREFGVKKSLFRDGGFLAVVQLAKELVAILPDPGQQSERVLPIFPGVSGWRMDGTRHGSPSIAEC
jgi:hypothetical protein